MTRTRKTIRYAVVGLGHIAQVAVLPAFAHARRNSELAALVSDDPVKSREMSRRYRVKDTFTYDEYESCLEQVDAVYIALPNSMHAEFTIRAARAGVAAVYPRRTPCQPRDLPMLLTTTRFGVSAAKPAAEEAETPEPTPSTADAAAKEHAEVADAKNVETQTTAALNETKPADEKMQDTNEELERQ